MTEPVANLLETVTLNQASALIKCMAHEQSILLLSAPGIGKSDTVASAAKCAGLECRSLLGTQIAPEDVSGIPRIVGERSVFCPPRILLPEDAKPFCLFLDELPACSPDIQKAFYSLLLERRLGEHPLPRGTWVVAAGNRAEDRALVRSISSALVNRVTILNVVVNNNEWLQWASANKVRSEILAFILFMPTALMRAVPKDPIPFSTPRSWASLSRSLDLAENAKVLNRESRRALAFGKVSAEDAAIFCAVAEQKLDCLPDPKACILYPEMMLNEPTVSWFVCNALRQLVLAEMLTDFSPEQLSYFLQAIPTEFRFALFVDLVEKWGALGVDQIMLHTLREATGLGGDE